MRTLAELVLSNAAMATVLAIVAAVAGRFCRRPQVIYALWLLVLLKLVTPPLFRIPINFLPPLHGGTKISEDFSQPVEPRLASAEDAVADRPQPDLGLDQTSPPFREQELAAIHQDDVAQAAEIERPVASPIIHAGDQNAVDELVGTARDQASNTGRISAESASHRYRRVPWSELLLCVWAVGALVWLSVVVIRLVRFRREVGRLRTIDSKLQECADELALCMGLRRAPVVRLVDAVVPPLLWAMFRPAEILLPRSLVARLSPDQQATLLAHELAHYRRRDHLVRWFEIVVIGLYWWHPIAWIARRELQRAEEQCCDAWVLWTLPGRQCAYARVILETIDFLAADRRPAPMLATGLGPVHPLERRFEMILHARPMRRLPAAAKWSVLLLGLLVLPISTKAQVADDRPGEPKIEARPAVEAAPAVEAVAPVVAIEATAVDVVDAPSDLAPGVAAVQAEPSVQPVNSNSIEQRLQRLEKLVETIAAEMKNQRVGSTRAYPYRAVTDYGITAERVARTLTAPTEDDKATLTLSALKKRRIDIEDQLEDLKEKLGEIDDQIAKLQSARPSKRYTTEKLQAK